MGVPLPTFYLSDPMSNSLGWDMVIPQQSPGARVFLNNQSDTEFAVFGNTGSYIGNVPAWLTYVEFILREQYIYLELRPVTRLNVQGASANYVSGMFYEAGEPRPPILPLAVVRSVDLNRQQRMVSVPMALSHWVQGRWLDTDPPVVTFSTAFISATQQAKTPVIAPIYLYYANCVPEADISAGMTFLLQMQWQDSGNNNLGGPFIFARGGVIANSTAFTFTPWTFAPSWPLGAIGGAPAGADHALLQIAYQNGGRLKVDYTIAMWMDQANVIGVSDIGTQALYNAKLPNANPYF